MTPGSQAAPRYFVRVSPRLPWVLAGVVTALLLIHVSLQTYHYTTSDLDLNTLSERKDTAKEKEDISWLLRDLFDVDEENNIPTWYSHFALLVASGLILSIANGKRRGREPFARHWLGLSIVFAFLALDEDAGLHETINTYADHLSSGEHNYWEIGGIIGASIFALAYLRFWIKLPPRTRLLFALAGAGYVLGAVGIEHISQPLLGDSIEYNLLTAVEEGCEMYSIVLFIHALIGYMRASDGSGPEIAVETGRKGGE